MSLINLSMGGGITRAPIYDSDGNVLSVGDYIDEIAEPELEIGNTIYQIYSFSPERQIYAHVMDDPDDGYRFEGQEVIKISEQEVSHRILSGKIWR
jgi:hypothetical protein